MSPADSFVWAVVAASAAWLLVGTVVPATLRAFIAASQRIPPFSRPIAAIVAAILLVGAYRSSPSFGIVPPPTERVIVDGTPPSNAVAARNPVLEVVTSSNQGQTYTVVAGDTLWGIARDILERSGDLSTGADIAVAWKMIYSTNTDVVGPDPNLILPGQVLTIPGGVYG